MAVTFLTSEDKEDLLRLIAESGGADGRGISNAYVDKNGYLHIEYTDNTATVSDVSLKGENGRGIQSAQITESGYLQILYTDGSKFQSSQPIVNYTVTFTIDESGEIFANKTIAECLEAHNKGLSVEARLIGLDTEYRGRLSDVITNEEDSQIVETVKFLLASVNDATKHIEISTNEASDFGCFDLEHITLALLSDIPDELPSPEHLTINGVSYDGSKPVDMTDNILELIYPVGSIYLSMNGFNPKDYFGFGTWKQIEDRFLLAAGDTYTAGSTGGEATHKLTAKELPKQEGTIVTHGTYAGTPIADVTGVFSKGHIVSGKYLSGSQGTSTDSIDVIKYSNGGEGQAHNNMPPYIVVHVWYRMS